MRRSLARFALGVNRTNSFSNGALELIKLKLMHKNVSKDKQNEKEGLEQQFNMELEKFRPLYTVCGSMQVQKFYNKQLLSTLKYFGKQGDPLYRSISNSLGGKAVKEPFQQQRYRLANSTRSEPRDVFFEPSISPFPDEYPFPNPEVYEHSSIGSKMPPKAIQYKDKDRGHWVLRDPDIAIKKDEREDDAW